MNSRAFALLIGFVIAASGCGGGNSNICKVSGTLTYKGQPIPQVYLRFVPDDLNTKATSMAMTDANGKFDMAMGSTYGVYKGKVTVYCDDPLAAMGGKTAIPKEIEPAYRELCAKYGDKKSAHVLTIEKSVSDLKLALD